MKTSSCGVLEEGYVRCSDPFELLHAGLVCRVSLSRHTGMYICFSFSQIMSNSAVAHTMNFNIISIFMTSTEHLETFLKPVSVVKSPCRKKKRFSSVKVEFFPFFFLKKRKKKKTFSAFDNQLLKCCALLLICFYICHLKVQVCRKMLFSFGVFKQNLKQSRWNVFGPFHNHIY